MTRKQLWGCFYCKNRKNVIAHERCNICGKSRDPGRFTILHNSCVYLCKVHLTLRLPTVAILKMGTSTEELTSTQSLASLAATEFTLRECVIQTLINWISDNESEDVQESLASDLKPTQDTNSLHSRSLFEQVLHNAQHKAYDANIGRYVDRDTVDEGRENVKLHLLYVEQLKHSEGEKRRLVRETKEKTLKRGQLSHQSHRGDDPMPDDKRISCVLCNQAYFKSQQYIITNKRAAMWFESHNVAIDPLDRRFHPNYCHEEARVCLFCYQFFDDGSVVDAAASNIAIRSEIDEALLNSPLKIPIPEVESVRPPLAGAGSSTTHLRPLSAIAIDTALFKLKQKHDMTQLGLRYQRIEAHGIDKGGMLDQERFGRFLRDKYTTIKDVLVEAKKNELKAMKKSLRYKSCKSKGPVTAVLSTVPAPVDDSNKEKETVSESNDTDIKLPLTDVFVTVSAEMLPEENNTTELSLEEYDVDDFEKDAVELEDDVAVGNPRLTNGEPPRPAENTELPIILPKDKPVKVVSRRCPLVLFVSENIPSVTASNPTGNSNVELPVVHRRIELQSVRSKLDLQKVQESSFVSLPKIVPIEQHHNDKTPVLAVSEKVAVTALGTKGQTKQARERKSSKRQKESSIQKQAAHRSKSVGNVSAVTSDADKKLKAQPKPITSIRDESTGSLLNPLIGLKSSNSMNSSSIMHKVEPSVSIYASQESLRVSKEHQEENEENEYEDDFDTEYDNDEFEVEAEVEAIEEHSITAAKADNQWISIDIFNVPSTVPDMFGSLSPAREDENGSRKRLLNVMTGQPMSGRAQSSHARSDQIRQFSQGKSGVEVISPSMRVSSQTLQKSPNKPRSVSGSANSLRYFERIESEGTTVLAENISSWFWDMEPGEQDTNEATKKASLSGDVKKVPENRHNRKTLRKMPSQTQHKMSKTKRKL